MITGKTAKGFDFAVQDDVLDDMELLEGLISLDNGEVSHLTDTLEALLGKEQKKALYEFLRGENGRVKATDVMAAVAEIFAALSDKSKAAKN